YKLLDWHKDFLMQWYEVDPEGHRWWYEEAIVGAESGASKTEFFAALAVFELCAARGWDGAPAEFHRKSHIITMAAASYEQAGEQGGRRCRYGNLVQHNLILPALPVAKDVAGNRRAESDALSDQRTWRVTEPKPNAVRPPSGTKSSAAARLVSSRLSPSGRSVPRSPTKGISRRWRALWRTVSNQRALSIFPPIASIAWHHDLARSRTTIAAAGWTPSSSAIQRRTKARASPPGESALAGSAGRLFQLRSRGEASSKSTFCTPSSVE